MNNIALTLGGLLSMALCAGIASLWHKPAQRPVSGSKYNYVTRRFSNEIDATRGFSKGWNG